MRQYSSVYPRCFPLCIYLLHPLFTRFRKNLPRSALENDLILPRGFIFLALLQEGTYDPGLANEGLPRDFSAKSIGKMHSLSLELWVGWPIYLHLPRACSGLALDVPHPRKSLSPTDTRMTGQPNCKLWGWLKPGVATTWGIMVKSDFYNQPNTQRKTVEMWRERQWSKIIFGPPCPILP